MTLEVVEFAFAMLRKQVSFYDEENEHSNSTENEHSNSTLGILNFHSEKEYRFLNF